MNKRIASLIVLLGFFIAMAFANCSNVTLSPVVEVEGQSILKGRFCLEDELEGMTLESAYIFNLNLRLNQGLLQEDRDGDGLMDSEEEQFGFDPSKRRTNGVILDSVCMKIAGDSDCEAQTPVCTEEEQHELSSGLSLCDYRALRLSGGDSDGDSLADALEHWFGTSPIDKDSLADFDRDGLRNFEEVLNNSDPRYADKDVDTAIFPKVNTRILPDDVSCAGESWAVVIPELWVHPFPNLNEPSPQETTEEQNTNLSSESEEDKILVPSDSVSFVHDYNENIFILYIILKPTTKIGGKSQLYTQTFRAKSGERFQVNLDDMQIEKEW